MRAEDIVGAGFFLTLFVGVGVTFYGSSRAKGSPERARLLSAGLGITGSALCAFGALTTYFIRISARPVMDGYVWAVSNGSVRYRGSTFRVTGDSGEVALIRCTYDGPGLREGERARVRYLEYDDRLIELTMLNGPYTGWHLQESAGEWDYAWFALIGLVCGVSAYRVRFGTPQGGGQAKS